MKGFCFRFNVKAFHSSDEKAFDKLFSQISGKQRLIFYRDIKRVLQKNRCFYCQCRMTIQRMGVRTTRRTDCTGDHLIPRSEGGRVRLDNIVAACAGCNNTKQSVNWLEFIKQKHPMYQGVVYA